ncbi:hypothetical protein ACFQ3P_23490 [Paraburkholderia sabiae]|uniref:Uncharacterized protein n=1 Tax=Paraburkholderia sabiae TaxID=273251 RepID=A0ABU9QF30_9BURK|nr:hypothetical protein [Paraburkholderia sabiae]WJZ72835.1 hypothetical protein QEN71_22135 [Paraburkholderia sabiae]CAD6549180.1 hypothetical protein LMG24235_04642 [Paraburkholderia sabiae]CAG9213839.1 conserved hypothetical protein [Paraburkholderia sabiae]
MKTSQQHATGDEHEEYETRPEGNDQSNVPKRPFGEEAAPLPHESDQSMESQHEHEPRGVGKQAHSDLEHGLEDTDRRGGGDYQERTQNDEHVNENSAGTGDKRR